nr:MAG: hypothetical protein [Porcellio scaber clopovirus]
MEFSWENKTQPEYTSHSLIYEDSDIIMDEVNEDDENYEINLSEKLNDSHIDENYYDEDSIDSNNMNNEKPQQNQSSSLPSISQPDVVPIDDLIKVKCDLYGFVNDSATAENREGKNETTHLSIENFKVDPEKEHLYFIVQNKENGTITNFPMSLDPSATPITHYSLTNLYPRIPSENIPEKIKKLETEIEEAKNEFENLRQRPHNNKVIFTHQSANYNKYNVFDRITYYAEKIGAERSLPGLKISPFKRDPYKYILEFSNPTNKKHFLHRFYNRKFRDNASVTDYLIRSKRKLLGFLIQQKHQGIIKYVKTYDGEFKISFVGEDENSFHYIQSRKHFEELKKLLYSYKKIM